MAIASPSTEDEVKESVAMSKDSDSSDSADTPLILNTKDDAGDLTYNTLSSSASQMLLKPTDHIRRLSRVFVNFFQSVPNTDTVLCQLLLDTWSDFTRKFPFFFSIVHRKFKLENDFSFRIHTRTLFAFELPSDTSLKMRVDMKKANSLFGEEMQSARFRHIFQHPRILELSRGEGDYVGMEEARELVKLVSESLCPATNPTADQDLVVVHQPQFVDNVPMFSLHVVFCSQGGGARSRCRHSMIQLLRHEFISMLTDIVISCALPARLGDVQRDVLEQDISKCWDVDVIEKQSQQESLWMKISLRLYCLISTLMNTGLYDDQRLALVLRLWKQADQNAEAQLHRAKDVQRKRRRSIEDKNSNALTPSALLEAQLKSKSSLVRQGLEGNGIGPWNLSPNSFNNPMAMLPALSNQLQQLHNMLQMQQMQSMAHMNPGQLQAFQFMQQQQVMQQQLMNRQQMFTPGMSPFSMAGLGSFAPSTNFLGHDKMPLNPMSIGVGTFPSVNPMWSSMSIHDSFPSPNMMVHPGNSNPNSMNAFFNSMPTQSFPLMPPQPNLNPWMGNQLSMPQILGGCLNASTDTPENFGSASEPRAFIPLKSNLAQILESGQKHDLASVLKKRSTAFD